MSTSSSPEPASPPLLADGPAGAGETIRALLNVLEDFVAERERLSATQRAVLNILEDASDEQRGLQSAQRALMNILEDFGAEKARLEETQRAVLNILDDFEAEKRRAEAINEDLRREAAERETAQQALQRSNAELEQFAYVASHDLQEPLRMVSSYVELFARRYEGQVDEQAGRYIRYAVDGARRMQALINGLLEYSRVGRRAQPGPVQTEAALHVALENLRSTLEETGGEVSAGPLPPVVVDFNQAVQLFQNLLGNALKFRRPGVPPRVRVEARPDGERGEAVLFEVRDNGIGIDPRHAERIFVIFQRLHTRAEYPGTGIGLSICKKVVERHGGRIWAEPAEGGGASFKFTLPRARAARGEVPSS